MAFLIKNQLDKYLPHCIKSNIMKRNFLFVLLALLSMELFAQQADLSLVPYRQGNKWGYAAPDKKLVIKPAFDEAAWFYSGYAAVKKGNKYGYIDRAGKLTIPYKFTVAKPFRYGYISVGNKGKEDTVLFAGASLVANGYEICINTKGVRMPKCPAINENSVPENRVSDEMIKQRNYTLDSSNRLVDKINDDYTITGNSDTYYIGSKTNSFGVFNNKFEVIVPFEYSSLKKITSGNNNYLLVTKDGKDGVLNGDGSVFIPVENSTIKYLKANNSNDYFIVTNNGQATLKNLANKDLLTQKYSAIEYDGTGGFVVTAPNNMKGYYFLNDQLIEPKYADIRLVAGGKYLSVKTATGKTGFVNSGGEEFFSDL